jgi:hypothetical protein
LARPCRFTFTFGRYTPLTLNFQVTAVRNVYIHNQDEIMIQSLQKLFTFDEYLEFLETQQENIRYELHDGDIIKMPPPSGKHEQIVAFLTMMLGYECLRLKLNYGIPKTATVKPENKMSGYYPDVLSNRIQESGVRKQIRILYDWRMNNRRFCTPTKQENLVVFNPAPVSLTKLLLYSATLGDALR